MATLAIVSFQNQAFLAFYHIDKLLRFLPDVLFNELFPADVVQKGLCVHIIKVIADEMNLRIEQVKGAVKLLDEGNTIPFITRYRKEHTGSLDEEQLRELNDRLTYLRHLEKRKEEILEKIRVQGKLTTALATQITAATQLKTLEDLYLPYRPKRRTRAVIAREKGLADLAQWLLEGHAADPETMAAKYLNPEKEVPDSSTALAGARDIIAEKIAEDAQVRQLVRTVTRQQAVLTTKKSAVPVNGEEQYADYFTFSQEISSLPPHRILAINRGEAECVLRVKLHLAEEAELLEQITNMYLANPQVASAEHVRKAVADAYKRLIAPAISREIRAELTAKAQQHAIEIFARNLRHLLLQPPIKEMRVLAIDPGYQSGCKTAVLSELGELLEYGVIYPHAPRNHWQQAVQTLQRLVAKYQVKVIAIGNGTASRETEELVSEVVQSSKIAYVIVSEAGASVYSASKTAREEFPELDASYRGTISIGRRLLDPLAELVKIDPKSLGVGLYQHDVNVKDLEKALSNVVESCVNYVGVDLNHASVDLLSYVAGINRRTAANIVKYRRELGRFANRQQLLQVSGIGQETFTQAAGFLRIYAGDNPLDATPIHPESYGACEKLLNLVGADRQDLVNEKGLALLRLKLGQVNMRNLAQELELGLPTTQDIIASLKRPGRDPRENFPPPLFKKGILQLADLEPGMLLKGTVRNVVDFGAFVDIGLKHDGLVHISQMSRHYVTDPLAVCKVGDIVEVKVLQVDEQRGRISLSMIL